MLRAVYPSTFDPITRGHEDVVRRAVRLFDEVIVAIAENRYKTPFFSLEERVGLAREVLAGIPGVRVEGFSSLLIDFAAAHRANVVLRVGFISLNARTYSFSNILSLLISPLMILQNKQSSIILLTSPGA